MKDDSATRLACLQEVVDSLAPLGKLFQGVVGCFRSQMASERPIFRVTALSAKPLAHLDASSAPFLAAAERYGMTARAVKECLKSHSISFRTHGFYTGFYM